MKFFPAAFASLILLSVASAPANADGDIDQFFATHCLQCHGPDKQESDLRLDTLKPPTAEEASQEQWSAILDMIESGDMPPAKQPRPEAAEIARVGEWISAELTRNAKRVPALRRMNRTEYEYTVQDLLGIDTEVAEFLPEDSSVQGFDNVAGGLGLSSILMEKYLEAANVAFESTIRRIKPLPPETRRAVLMDMEVNQATIKKTPGRSLEAHGAFVDFSPAYPITRIDPAHPIEDGVYRCRFAVWPHEPNEHRTLAVGVYVGPLFGVGKRRFIGMYDVTGTPDKPRVIEFTTFLKEAQTIHILPWVYPEHVSWRDKEEKPPGVAIVWAETHGPLDQAFPSESTKRLFGAKKSVSMAEGWPVYIRHRRGVKSHNVASTTPRDDAERIIREFAPRAFRRPVPDELTEQFVAFTLSRLDGGATFEQAIQAGVTAVLCSPHFLLLNHEAEVDDYTIASRLSYFLWSSMPDEELLKLAAEGKLRDKRVVHEQVDRMLADPKSERFVENFTAQWLDLREIEFTTPDGKLYPEYSEILLRSMLAETHGFFRHVLENDLSVMNFIDSDFAVLNQRMATHYGIEGIRGHEQFRVVPLLEDSIRGGIMTHASVLKVTANGTSTSPVIRGVWVLDKLLGQPAPPPPPGVPAVEPDIRGATSIREQLKLHSTSESCARCHKRIDGPGFALEEFDVIGGYRDYYRSLGDKGERVSKTNYRIGPAVDKGGSVHGQGEFADFAGFRQLLLDDPDTIARSLAEKLLVYGCGRPVTAADRESVDSVVAAAKEHDLGLRSMIHAVVDSELFLSP